MNAASRSGRKAWSAVSPTATATGPLRVAHSTDLIAFGIDAEPHGPLPEGLVGDIAFGEELQMLDVLACEVPAVCWDRLLFSAKESLYKTWFPLTRRWLGFEDARLELDPAGTFEARLLVEGWHAAGRRLERLSGSWLAKDGLLVAAIALPF